MQVCHFRKVSLSSSVMFLFSLNLQSSSLAEQGKVLTLSNIYTRIVPIIKPKKNRTFDLRWKLHGSWTVSVCPILCGKKLIMHILTQQYPWKLYFWCSEFLSLCIFSTTRPSQWWLLWSLNEYIILLQAKKIRSLI